MSIDDGKLPMNTTLLFAEEQKWLNIKLLVFYFFGWKETVHLMLWISKYIFWSIFLFFRLLLLLFTTSYTRNVYSIFKFTQNSLSFVECWYWLKTNGFPNSKFVEMMWFRFWWNNNWEHLLCTTIYHKLNNHLFSSCT